MFRVGHSVTNDVLKENLEDRTGLLVNEAGDALHTTTTRQTANRRLRDALDVVAQDFAVALSAACDGWLVATPCNKHMQISNMKKTFAEALATFATS